MKWEAPAQSAGSFLVLFETAAIALQVAPGLLRWDP